MVNSDWSYRSLILSVYGMEAFSGRSRAADLGRPVVQLQIGHYDRSEIGARYELLRRKAHKTVDRAEIEFAVQIPESRLIVELIAGQPVAGGINFQVPRQRFITGQPLVRTDPQIFIFILDHFIHDIVRESVPVVYAVKSPEDGV